MDKGSVTREVLVREQLGAEGYGLLRREDGFYHVTVHGAIIAPFDWHVRSGELNDGGGDVGSPYPLTLGWIEHWLRGGMGRSPLL